MRGFKSIVSGVICSATVLFAQNSEPAPKFEIADVHVSAKATNQFGRPLPVRGGRYEVKTATMADLVRFAYGFDADKILGGPNWLEMDRFDVVAKLPPESTPDTQKLMLQALLEERFKLVLHKETQQLPTYALTVGKKPQLKEADGSGSTGCKPQTSSGGPRADGGIRLFTSGADGAATAIDLGPGMTIQFQCRNMSMASFAGGLRGMMGAASAIGNNPILDETGLKGSWNFDVKWSMQLGGPMPGAPGDRISVFEAVEKQLGLKLEQRQVPTPVIVVDSINRRPTENSPEVARVLARIPVPTEFEVADIKLTSPDFKMGNFQMQPGGRLVSKGMAMRFLLNRAFNTFNNDQIVGLPKWVDSERFDITAKVPASGPAAPPLDMESVSPLMLALLLDRFKLKYHTEERLVSTYALVAAKPKMKKAEPASRSSCKFPNAPVGAPPGTRVITCQNYTMSDFADRLQNFSRELNWPILNATELEGGWDLTLTFSQSLPGMFNGGPGRGGPPGQATDVAAAAEPTGALTIFEAIEKQLGLKLESRKRTMPVIVIDQLEQKPTEN